MNFRSWVGKFSLGASGDVGGILVRQRPPHPEAFLGSFLLRRPFVLADIRNSGSMKARGRAIPPREWAHSFPCLAGRHGLPPRLGSSQGLPRLGTPLTGTCLFLLPLLLILALCSVALLGVGRFGSLGLFELLDVPADSSVSSLALASLACLDLHGTLCLMVPP